MSLHPEGEDQSTEAVEALYCPHCYAKIAIPEVIPVDEFACPECRQMLSIRQLTR